MLNLTPPRHTPTLRTPAIQSGAKRLVFTTSGPNFKRLAPDWMPGRPLFMVDDAPVMGAEHSGSRKRAKGATSTENGAWARSKISG